VYEDSPHREVTDPPRTGKACAGIVPATSIAPVDDPEIALIVPTTDAATPRIAYNDPSIAGNEEVPEPAVP
jgi:hypothetical protein